VVINNGGDGATSQAWVQGGAAAGERGYHRVAFDGPGQAGRPVRAGIAFRPDCEAVLTPVLDPMPWVGSCVEVARRGRQLQDRPVARLAAGEIAVGIT
jgi:hypothetical protein